MDTKEEMVTLFSDITEAAARYSNYFSIFVVNHNKNQQLVALRMYGAPFQPSHRSRGSEVWSAGGKLTDTTIHSTKGTKPACQVLSDTEHSETEIEFLFAMNNHLVLYTGLE